MTIQQHASFDSSAAELNATSKLVKAWESKNAKNAAKAGGISMMALSLAACGGSSTTVTTPVVDAPVVDTPVVDTPVVADPVNLAVSLKTDGGEVVSGGDGDDSFTGVLVGAAAAGTTAQPGDQINGGAGADKLTISASGDVDGYTLAGLQTTGVETIVVANFDTDTAKTFTIDTSLFSDVAMVGLSASGANGDTAFSGMLSIVDATLAGAGDLTLTYDATAVSGLTDVQNVSLNNSSGAFTVNSVETVSVTSNILANTISTLSADSATTLNISGSKDLTITGEISATVANIKTIDASAMTGSLKIENNDTTTNATLGAGDDVYKTSTAVAVDYKVDGGAGTDELSVTAATVLDTALETARYENFEQLQINNIGAKTAAFGQDMSLLAGYDVVTVVAQDSTDGDADASMTSAITNTADGTTVKFESLSTAEDAHKLTVGVTVDHATDNTTNTLDVVMGTATAASGATVTSATNAKAYATLTANNAETISVMSQGGANTLGALTSADLTTLNISGSKDLTIGAIGGATKLASVDASALTGTAKFVMASTNASTTAGTYTGSANDDTLVGGSKADTINAGAGDDTITGGGGDDVLNGQAGDDTFNDSAGDETRNGGDGADNFKFATANFTSKDTVSGGAGADKITITNAATIVDADFTNVTTVETLTLAAAATDADLGTLADAAGIRTVVSTAGANNDDINIVKDFASDITIQIGQGDDTITAAATYAGAMTVDLSTLGDADDLDGNDTITGGAGSDTLLVKATGTAVTATELGGVSGIETIKIANNASTGAITLADANTADGKAITVDGTALVSDSTVLTVVGTAEADGALTVLGGAGDDVLTGTQSDLGDTLNGNGGADTFNFATANLTKLDTVNGGDGTDTLATSDGGTLVDADFTGITNVENVTLFAGTTVTLGALAMGAGFEKYTTSTGTNSVTVGAGFAADLTLNLVAGTDTVAASAFTKDLTIKYADWDGLAGTDTLTGGTGTNDTLNLNATSSTLTATELGAVTGFEKIVLAADEATGAITLADVNTAAAKSMTVDASALVTTNAVSISAGNETDGLVTIIGGAAGDTITMSTSTQGGDTITAGGGDDTINVTVAGFTQLDTINGGSGTADNIVLTSAGTLSDASFTNVTNVEKLTDGNSNTTIILGSAAAAAGITTVSLVTGSNTNSVTLGAGYTNDVTVALTDNTDTVQGTSYTGKMTVTVAEDNLTNGDTITGGSGADTLTITFDDTTSDEVSAAEMVNVTKIETIKSGSNTLANISLNDANVAKAGSLTLDFTKNTGDAVVMNGSAELDGSLVVIGGGGGDTITGGAKNDTIDGKAGTDTITGGKGADALTGGADADTFVYTAADQSTTSGADSITDFVSGTDKIAVTIDYSTNVNALTVDATVNTAAAGTTNVAAGLSGAIGQATYDTTNSQLVINGNADNLITTTDYVVGVNAAATAANTIAEGDINFTISTGSAGDTIVAGSGADTINAGAGGDTITGGAGNDTIDADAGIDTITGGAGDDAISLGGSDSAVDTVKIAYGGEGVDTIAEFEAGANKDVVDFTGTRDVNDVANADLDVDGFLLFANTDDHALIDGLTVFNGNSTKAIDAGSYLTAAEIATFLGDLDGSSGGTDDHAVTVGSAGDIAYVLVEGDAGNSTLAQVTGGGDTAIDEADVTIIAHFTGMESEDMLAGNFADFA